MPQSAYQPGDDISIDEGVSLRTKFSDRIYIGILQCQFDQGLPYPQDVVRLLVAAGLEKLGYPKEVHKITKPKGKKG